MMFSQPIDHRLWSVKTTMLWFHPKSILQVVSQTHFLYSCIQYIGMAADL